MVEIRVTGPAGEASRRRETIVPLDARDIASGHLQEGDSLDFKREVNLDKADGKARLVDDVVAFSIAGRAA